MKSMTRLLWALSLIVISTASLPAQSWWGNGIKGEGPVVERELQLDDFHSFSMGINGKVYLQQGRQQSVRVEAQENIIENIETEVRNGYWKITFDENVRRHDAIRIYISIPDLQVAKVSGSGDIIGESRFTGLDEVELGISGSGSLSLDLDARDLESTISGSGNMEIAGKSGKHQIRISGSGDVDAHELVTRESYIRISGSGDVEVHATEKLEVSTSGSGDVYYAGRPRVKAQVSGSGDVEPRG